MILLLFGIGVLRRGLRGRRGEIGRRRRWGSTC